MSFARELYEDHLEPFVPMIVVVSVIVLMMKLIGGNSNDVRIDPDGRRFIDGHYYVHDPTCGCLNERK